MHRFRVQIHDGPLPGCGRAWIASRYSRSADIILLLKACSR